VVSESDSDESSSSAGNGRKKQRNQSKSDESKESKSSESESESDSVDSYDSNESFRSNEFDYTQSDGTQLNPYQNEEQENEIQFQTDSDGEEATGTTRSGTQYTLAGDETGEIFLVGATGHNYGNTAELNTMTYKQAMASVDKEEWDAAVKVEHDKMKKYKVFRVVNRKDLPPGTKLFDQSINQSINYQCHPLLWWAITIAFLVGNTKLQGFPHAVSCHFVESPRDVHHLENGRFVREQRVPTLLEYHQGRSLQRGQPQGIAPFLVRFSGILDQFRSAQVEESCRSQRCHHLLGLGLRNPVNPAGKIRRKYWKGWQLNLFAMGLWLWLVFGIEVLVSDACLDGLALVDPRLRGPVDPFVLVHGDVHPAEMGVHDFLSQQRKLRRDLRDKSIQVDPEPRLERAGQGAHERAPGAGTKGIERQSGRGRSGFFLLLRLREAVPEFVEHQGHWCDVGSTPALGGKIRRRHRNCYQAHAQGSLDDGAFLGKPHTVLAVGGFRKPIQTRVLASVGEK